MNDQPHPEKLSAAADATPLSIFYESGSALLFENTPGCAASAPHEWTLFASDAITASRQPDALAQQT